MRKIAIHSAFLCGMLSNISYASDHFVDCNAVPAESVSDALDVAVPGDKIIVSGTCNELINIATDDITIAGGGTATIDGAGLFYSTDVVRVDGARRVVVQGLNIKNGLFGVGLQREADAKLDGVMVSNNLVMGVHMANSSSITLNNTTLRNNAVNGLEVTDNSSVVVKGTLDVLDNGVFGVDVVHNSSLRFSKANVNVHGNIVGVQVGINSSGFIEDSTTTLNTSNNRSIGLTVVSTSSFFLFKGNIISNNNGTNDGIAVFTNSSMDIDRNARVEANGNGRDGILLEGSMFNIVRMPGEAPTIIANENRRNGMSALVMSQVDFAVESTLEASRNLNAGVFVDNGSTARLINASLKQNGAVGDLVLTFAARADVSTSDIGVARCDKTTLLRGDEVKCKKLDDDE